MVVNVNHEATAMGLLSILLHSPEKQTMNLLLEELRHLPKGQYIWINVLLFQIYQWLMHETNGPTVEILVKLLKHALAITDVTDIQSTDGQCMKFLQCLFHVLQTVSTNMTDECRIHLMECIELLCTSETPLPFLSSSVPFLAYMVTGLITCAQNDSSRVCRVHALKCLKSILQGVDDAQVLTQVFPGLSSSLFQLIKADYKLGSKLPASAIDCLSIATVLVLGDVRCGDLVERPNFYLAFLEKDKNAESKHLTQLDITSQNTSPSHGLPNTLRSISWLETTQANMDILISNVCTHQRHHPKALVRSSLLSFCSIALSQCRLSLAPSFFPLYETILAMAQDPIPEILAQAKSSLDHLHTELSPSELVILNTQGSSRFLLHTETLSRKCETVLDLEGEAISTMQLCMGYLAGSPSMDLALETQINRVLRAWCRILAIDSVDAQVLAYTTWSDKCVVAYFRKRFVHFRSDEATSIALSVVRLIGTVGNLPTLIDAIFQQLHDTEQSKRNDIELLVLLNQFILGAANFNLPASFNPMTDRRIDVHVVGYLLNNLLQLPLWNSSDGMSEDCQSLMIEVVGSCAQALCSQFNSLLMHVLYPIIEQLGRPSKLVQQAAIATLERIAYFCQYESVPDLLHKNMDYVIDVLCLRLQQLDVFPYTPFVVEGLLKQAGQGAPLPLLEDAVRGVVLSMDSNLTQGQHPLGLLRVMKVIVTNEPKPSHIKEPECPSLVDKLIQDMTTLFQEEVYEEVIEEIDAEKSPEEAMKGAMPIEHEDEKVNDSQLHGMPKLVHDIVIRCSYFIAAPDVATSCLAWQVLQESFAVFHLKDLRPLVHRVWPMLTRRLSSQTTAPILLAAVQCFSTLAELCGNFIGDKFIEAVWPAFKSILSAAHSKHNLARSELDLTQEMVPTTSVRLHSLTDQLHLHILICLAKMCDATDIMNSIARDVASTCIVFLSSDMPSPLQDQGLALFTSLVRLNGDELFPRLTYLSQFGHLPSPPSNSFPLYDAAAAERIIDKSMRHPSYSQNSYRILMKLMNNSQQLLI